MKYYEKLKKTINYDPCVNFFENKSKTKYITFNNFLYSNFEFFTNLWSFDIFLI